ncbi:hypothetical protein GGS20DRAFT_456475 [Poronia punctata]|nr:hypothetical protein GGS20DRAFT_456475 [Poronia punctata]
MAIMQLNRRTGLKFIFSGMLFALCILRSAALSVRIAWACYPHSANIAISAGIMAQLGSVLIFIMNLILTQRIVRGYHPKLGWHRATTIAFAFLLGCVVMSLAIVVVVTIQTFFTLDPATRNADRIAQLAGGTVMAVVAFMPIPIVTLAAATPRKCHVEKFGGGRWRTKVYILIFTAVLATLGAAFRATTAYFPRPATDPAWYHGRVSYYCFNFLTDLIISAIYLLTRFDRRFMIPDGAKGPGDYDRGLRVRPPSPPDTSVADTLGGQSRGDDMDPEKSPVLGGPSVDQDSKGQTPLPALPALPAMHPRSYEGKGKGKTTGFEVDKEVGGPHDTPKPRRRLSTEICRGPGEWEGLPWPPPVPWWRRDNETRMPPAPRKTPTPSDEGDPEKLFADFDTVSDSQDTTKCGGETSSSSCGQDSEKSWTTASPRSFHPRQMQNIREPHARPEFQLPIQPPPVHAYPHATISNAPSPGANISPVIHEDTPWPFTNPPPSRQARQRAIIVAPCNKSDSSGSIISYDHTDGSSVYNSDSNGNNGPSRSNSSHRGPSAPTPNTYRMEGNAYQGEWI